MHASMIAVRALFAYVFLLALVRATGKRTIGQATPLDFTVALVLGDMIDDLLWAEVSAAKFVVGCGMIALAHVIVSVSACRSKGLYALVYGRPALLAGAGGLDRTGMRGERSSDDDVFQLLRSEGVQDLRDIERMRLEVGGNPSLEKKPWAEEAQRKDAPRARDVMESRK
jgi:uncharacterized membrane protein YcaP (DUF421 family)